jgi:hypothetical protein
MGYDEVGISLKCDENVKTRPILANVKNLLKCRKKIW